MTVAGFKLFKHVSKRLAMWKMSLDYLDRHLKHSIFGLLHRHPLHQLLRTSPRSLPQDHRLCILVPEMTHTNVVLAGPMLNYPSDYPTHLLLRYCILGRILIVLLARE